MKDEGGIMKEESEKNVAADCDSDTWFGELMRSSLNRHPRTGLILFSPEP